MSKIFTVRYTYVTEYVFSNVEAKSEQEALAKAEDFFNGSYDEEDIRISSPHEFDDSWTAEED